jgi:hypothetical protein
MRLLSLYWCENSTPEGEKMHERENSELAARLISSEEIGREEGKYTG